MKVFSYFCELEALQVDGNSIFNYFVKMKYIEPEC